MWVFAASWEISAYQSERFANESVVVREGAIANRLWLSVSPHACGGRRPPQADGETPLPFVLEQLRFVDRTPWWLAEGFRGWRRLHLIRIDNRFWFF